MYVCEAEDIMMAHGRIKPHVRRTPVFTSTTLDLVSGRRLYFKCENLQRTGCFKIRGALNAVLQLTPEKAKRGVVTHSSGNHAQAVALAAKIRGIPAQIVLSENTPKSKRAAAESYGAIVHLCEPHLEAREFETKRIVDQFGCTYIPAFDHADVIAGQGTVALELLESHPDLDAIVVPVGGGGLVAGTAIYSKTVQESLRIFATEIKRDRDSNPGEPHGFTSKQKTSEDGIRAQLGELTWPVVRDLVEQMIPVEQKEIMMATRLILERMKLLIEPSAAAAVAVAIGTTFRNHSDIEDVGVVLCGGNLDLDHVKWNT